MNRSSNILTKLNILTCDKTLRKIDSIKTHNQENLFIFNKTDDFTPKSSVLKSVKKSLKTGKLLFGSKKVIYDIERIITSKNTLFLRRY